MGWENLQEDIADEFSDQRFEALRFTPGRAARAERAERTSAEARRLYRAGSRILARDRAAERARTWNRDNRERSRVLHRRHRALLARQEEQKLFPGAKTFLVARAEAKALERTRKALGLYAARGVAACPVLSGLAATAERESLERTRRLLACG